MLQPAPDYLTFETGLSSLTASHLGGPLSMRRSPSMNAAEVIKRATATGNLVGPYISIEGYVCHTPGLPVHVEGGVRDTVHSPKRGVSPIGGLSDN